MASEVDDSRATSVTIRGWCSEDRGIAAILAGGLLLLGVAAQLFGVVTVLYWVTAALVGASIWHFWTPWAVVLGLTLIIALGVDLFGTITQSAAAVSLFALLLIGYGIFRMKYGSD